MPHLLVLHERDLITQTADARALHEMRAKESVSLAIIAWIFRTGYKLKR